MSRASELPRRLAQLIEHIRVSPGPIQVNVGNPVQLDGVELVCRSGGVPLSTVRKGRPLPRGEVEAQATRGYLTAGSEKLPGVQTYHDIDSLGISEDRVVTARIRALLEEQWQRGVDLPSLGVWPSGSRIPSSSRLLPGKALAHLGDLGLGEDVAEVLTLPDGPFPETLRPTCLALLSSWGQLSGRTTVDTVVRAPSLTHPQLLNHLSSGIRILLGARDGGEVTGLRELKPGMSATERVSRLAGLLRLDPKLAHVSAIAGSHVLLLGTEWDEGWTMTVTGQLLLSAGAKTVRPFTLSTRTRSGRRQ
ncbi:hypothetical protein [Flaviflexus massiliensis]|uniref:hypothetical protein n=1 Tax=Flaviflexus massiliensis TaxID=1522309 RepID=UPI0006D58FA6|nr:hypothetical protein [Flaviflexus massiliensis]